MRTPRMTASARTRDRVRAAGLAGLAGTALAGAALTGCGSVAAPGSVSAGGSAPSGSAASASASGSAGASGTAPPSGQPSSQAAAAGTCPTSALKVTLDTSAAGAAAGSSFVPLQFENVSASSCTLPGYPAVSFAAAAAGPQIGPAAVRQPSGTTAPLVLTPGHYAHAWLQILDAANFPASACKPVTAQGFLVAFADSASAAYVARSVPTCARTQHGSNILAVFPVQAGLATRGSVP